MIKLVIFDMAGTSIDEKNLVYKTICKVLNEAGVNVELEEVLEIGAGKEKRKAIHELLLYKEQEAPDDQKVNALHDKFKKRLDYTYETIPLDVFPSVRKVISYLRNNGIKVGFNTGYSREVALKILDKVNIEIDGLCTASDVTANRPEPDMIHYLCKEFDVLPFETVKIGDSAIDIHEGKNAEVLYSIGITTGAQNYEQINKAKPDFIFDDMLELLPLVRETNLLT